MVLKNGEIKIDNLNHKFLILSAKNNNINLIKLDILKELAFDRYNKDSIINFLNIKC